MKKLLNNFILLIALSINYAHLVVAMEQAPLTPRTQAILLLNQKLKDHEETISLLCHARSQDMQLAQLRESKLEKQLNEIKKELQLTKQAIPCIMPVAEDEQSGPDSQKSVAVLLLKQAGSKGALIAQAIITRHYVSRSLQALIQKMRVNPRVKLLLSDAAPEISNLVAGAGTYATHRILESSDVYRLYSEIQLTLSSLGSKAYSAVIKPLDKEATCVTAILGTTGFVIGWVLSMRQEKLVVKHAKSMEIFIETLKGLK